LQNVLVTGGAGFIGSAFVRHLLRTHPDVRIVNLDALTYAGRPENLVNLPDPARHELVIGDIGDQALCERLLHERAIDTIVHFAAHTHVDRSIASPRPFVDTNVSGTFSLLEAARAAHAAGSPWVRFHHISTDEVYGTLAPGDPPFHENTPYAPRSPYAATKAASDHLVRAYAHTYGLPVTLSHCSNNYGPRQFPEKLIPLIILNAVVGQPLPVYGDGAQVRDWLHVDDHCEALCAILERGRPGETYHLGGDNGPTNLELVQHLCAILDERLPDSPQRPHAGLIRFVADRPGHDRRYAMDLHKVSSELGWRPRRGLDEGLRATVEWYLTEREWLRTVAHRPDFVGWLDANYAHRGHARDDEHS